MQSKLLSSNIKMSSMNLNMSKTITSIVLFLISLSSLTIDESINFLKKASDAGSLDATRLLILIYRL